MPGDKYLLNHIVSLFVTGGVCRRSATLQTELWSRALFLKKIFLSLIGDGKLGGGGFEDSRVELVAL